MPQIKKMDIVQNADQLGFSYTVTENAKFSTMESNLPVSHEMKYTLSIKPSNYTHVFTDEMRKHAHRRSMFK